VDLSQFFTSENMVALLTLIALEIVLGIDNVIFIAILSSKLPEDQQGRARQTGIGLAVFSRILLLLAISWVIGLTEPLITLFGKELSGRDLILLVGGLFLIAKSTHEIHEKLEAIDDAQEKRVARVTSFASVIVQVVVLDVVFSLDSVITAVGISGYLPVMIVAIIVAAGVMLVFSGVIARFVEKHPTMKVLALAFLILIGVLLVIEGWNPELVEEYSLKNYAYFAMFFSFLVELINMRFRKTEQPVQLHNQPQTPTEEGAHPGKGQV
jgi:predicted tellurium resistance membrane protein TerC